jgi:hypothetical protein
VCVRQRYGQPRARVSISVEHRSLTICLNKDSCLQSKIMCGVGMLHIQVFCFISQPPMPRTTLAGRRPPPPALLGPKRPEVSIVARILAVFVDISQVQPENVQCVVHTQSHRFRCDITAQAVKYQYRHVLTRREPVTGWHKWCKVTILCKSSQAQSTDFFSSPVLHRCVIP